MLWEKLKNCVKKVSISVKYAWLSEVGFIVVYVVPDFFFFFLILNFIVRMGEGGFEP